MVSCETLLSYPDWKIPLTVQTDDYYKYLSAVIIQNDKTIELFSIIISKPQHNNNTTEKELIAILECINQFCRILFGYEINYFSYNKILSMSES